MRTITAILLSISLLSACSKPLESSSKPSDEDVEAPLAVSVTTPF